MSSKESRPTPTQRGRQHVRRLVPNRGQNNEVKLQQDRFSRLPKRDRQDLKRRYISYPRQRTRRAKLQTERPEERRPQRRPRHHPQPKRQDNEAPNEWGQAIRHQQDLPRQCYHRGCPHTPNEGLCRPRQSPRRRPTPQGARDRRQEPQPHLQGLNLPNTNTVMATPIMIYDSY